MTADAGNRAAYALSTVFGNVVMEQSFLDAGCSDSGDVVGS
jgi:hypothetical protein